MHPVAGAVHQLIAGPLGAAAGILRPQRRHRTGDDAGGLQVGAGAVLRPDVAPHTHGGADVRVVQELLGHASVTTTQAPLTFVSKSSSNDSMEV